MLFTKNVESLKLIFQILALKKIKLAPVVRLGFEAYSAYESRLMCNFENN